jgi:hypothetical protein
VARQIAACVVAAVLAWTYGNPVHRAYRCVGDPPQAKTQHGCCPDDNQATSSVGRPCCERLPIITESAATLDHDAAPVPPPAIAFGALSALPAHVASVAPSRIRGGTSPPSQHPRTVTVLRI